MGIEPMTTPDLPTLRSILARLEAATGPDRELDGVIMGVSYTRDRRHIGAYEDPDNVPWLDDVWVDPMTDKWVSTHPYYFTASIDAAVALIERVLPSDWEWVASKIWGDGYSVQLMCEPHLVEVEKAPSPAIALCTALVKALIARAEIAGLTDREKETDHG